MEILDVDLVAFERGNGAERAAVVDGVMRSLATGFVYVAHDLAEGVIDEACEQFEVDPLAEVVWEINLVEDGCRLEEG